MSTQAPRYIDSTLPRGARFAVAAARFNADIVDELLRGCLARLQELGIGGDRVEVVRVPGAFELPVTARAFAESGRFAGVICLGAVIRGETPHFDYVAGECARGLQNLSVITGIPMIFGVLTTNDHQQALDRTGGKHGHAGQRAAEAAVEMAATLSAIAAPRKVSRGKRARRSARKR